MRIETGLNIKIEDKSYNEILDVIPYMLTRNK